MKIEVLGIDHVFVTVSDPSRSEKFYDSVMTILGFRKNSFANDGDAHIQYYNRHFGLVLRPAHSKVTTHDPLWPGLHHLCFRVEDAATVDAIAKQFASQGIPCSAPQLYSEYAPDYYAIFFSDPDGIRLEVTNYRQERRQRFEEWDKTRPLARQRNRQSMKSYSKYLASLERIQRHQAGRLFKQFQLICQAVHRLDSAVLKLQKGHWSDHGMEQGIFFSVWLGDKDVRENRFNYNIHALKLGSQKCCGVKPVAFARAFRSRFDPTGWPNISADYGPQTLMQGWLPLDERTFEQDVAGLIERFASMHHLIDDLLGHRKAA